MFCCIFRGINTSKIVFVCQFDRFLDSGCFGSGANIRKCGEISFYMPTEVGMTCISCELLQRKEVVRLEMAVGATISL
jgi:hypothetical protein